MQKLLRFFVGALIVLAFSARASASLTGSWSGSVGWFATQSLAPGNVFELAADRRPLSLSIGEQLEVTGAGGGCTISGTLGREHPAATVLSGELTFADCDAALFNGVYSDVRVARAGPDRIVVSLERRSRDALGGRRLEIRGTLND